MPNSTIQGPRVRAPRIVTDAWRIAVPVLSALLLGCGSGGADSDASTGAQVSDAGVASAAVIELVGRTGATLTATSSEELTLRTAAVSDASADRPGGAQTIGINLEYSRDWAKSRMFVDLMRSSRVFGPVDTPWSGPVARDADGWPTVDSFGTVVLVYSADEAPLLQGTYRLNFKGRAQSVSANRAAAQVVNLSYDPATDTSTADVVTQPTFAQQGILWLQFRGTGGKVRDISMRRPGYGPAERFSREFLQAIAPFSVLRTMDLTSTNGNPVAKWSQRATLASAQWGDDRGVPWEVVVDLANLAGKDLWINVPAQADDDYVRQLAALLARTLSPTLKVYVEYSNELWNYGFSQTRWNREQAITEAAAGSRALVYDGTSDTYVMAARRLARRSKEISDLFRAAFGDAAMMTRIRPVLATQAVSVYWSRHMLDMLQAVYGPPSRYFYGVAIAPYFSLNAAAQAATNLRKDDVLRLLGDSVESQKSIGWLRGHFTLATFYGLRLLGYEGGPDTAGANNLQAKRDAQADPRMGDIARRHLAIWASFGGGLYNWFNLAGSWDGVSGAWGLTDNIGVLSRTKYQAVVSASQVAAPAVTLGALVPAVIDARLWEGNPTPNATGIVFVNPSRPSLDYLLRTESTSNRSLTVLAHSYTPGAQLEVWLNNRQLASLAVPSANAPVALPAVPLELQAGVSALRLKTSDGKLSVVSSLRVQ